MTDISERAIPLLNEIAEAAATPDRWADFLAALADDLGGAAIGLTLEIPSIANSRLVYRHNLDPAYNAITARTIAENESPWVMQGLTDGFFRSLPTKPDQEVGETEYYRLCLVPQGVAPELPIAHVFAHRGALDVAAIIIYRREGCRHFTDDDIAMLNLLVPHLATAYRVHEELRGHRQRRNALAAVVDRFRNGVVLLDDEGRILTANHSGERILAASDGLERRDDRIRATDEAADERLQLRIDRAVRGGRGEPLAPPPDEEPVAVERPSGARSFNVIASSLIVSEAWGAAREAAAVVFISDPERGPSPTPGVLASLYGLTGAESQLVTLLCDGHSLESAAAVRSVTVHTARAQLKSVFRKTGATRQGDLIALVLRGLTDLQDPEGGNGEGPE